MDLNLLCVPVCVCKSICALKTQEVTGEYWLDYVDESAIYQGEEEEAAGGGEMRTEKGERREEEERGSFLTVLTDDGEQSKWPIAPGRSCNASDLVCVASVISWCIFHKANHCEKRLKGTHLALFPENYSLSLSLMSIHR